MKQSIIADQVVGLSMLLQIIGLAGLVFGWFSWYIAIPIFLVALGMMTVGLVWFVVAMRAEIKVIDDDIERMEKSNAAAELHLAELQRANAETEARV